MSEYRLLEESFPKAKKEHVCVWCGEKIGIGETYRREKSVYDGDMQNFSWHPECDAAFKKDIQGGVSEFIMHDNPRGKQFFPVAEGVEG